MRDGNLAEFLFGIRSGRVSRAHHRVRRLATSGNTRPWKVLTRIAADDFTFLPRHTENFRTDAMHVHHILRLQIANSGLKRDAAIRLDDQQLIKSSRAPHVTAQRYANASHFRPYPLRFRAILARQPNFSAPLWAAPIAEDPRSTRLLADCATVRTLASDICPLHQRRGHPAFRSQAVMATTAAPSS